MKKLFVMFYVAFAFLITGCASNLMKPSESETVKVASGDMATIVFMRTSFVASAVGLELFEVVDGELEFIGSLASGNKIAHQTAQGKKVYMSYGNAADFMIADVRAGKTYYSILRPNWGTGGFAPTPIRKSMSKYNMNSSDFSKWVKNTKLHELKKEEANKWFQENKAKYGDIYKKYWSRFQNKSESEKKERTLNPDDGV